MNILYERIKNIYLGLFFLSPKLLSTIIFIPFLYICGWILATPIFLLGVDKENLSLIGTIFTLLIYIFSLPRWFKLRWRTNNTWKLLGIIKTDNPILPHPRMHIRKFVLFPLRDIEPEWLHPNFNTKINDLILQCTDNQKIYKL